MVKKSRVMSAVLGAVVLAGTVAAPAAAGTTYVVGPFSSLSACIDHKNATYAYYSGKAPGCSGAKQVNGTVKWYYRYTAG